MSFTTTLKIKSFNLQEISSSSTILINAKRASGKSFLIRMLIDYSNTKLHYPAGVLCSYSEKLNHFYKDFFPDSYIYDDCEKAIHKVLTRQKHLIAENDKRKKEGKSLYDIRLLLVLDDVISNAKEWGRSQDMKEVMFNGRHYGITLIIAVQDTMALPPASRNNFDYIFLFNNDINSELVKMYNHFAGIFENVNSFKEVLAQVTEDYGILVIIRRGNASNRLEDKIAHFRAKEYTHPPKMFGCSKFIEYHNKYYDKDWFTHEFNMEEKYGITGKHHRTNIRIEK